MLELKCLEKRNKLSDLDRIIECYSPGNWVDINNFKGNFFNFGYWDGIDIESNLKESDRIQSSASLYQKTTEDLRIIRSDIVLDIGCGRGIGTCLVDKLYLPRHIVGIDVTPSQVNFASENAKNSFNTEFFVANACKKTPFKENYFDKIFSVEAIQHFLSLPNFSKEICRILRPSGLLSISGFFSTNGKNQFHLAERFDQIKEGVENIFSVDYVIDVIESAGFLLKKNILIGQHVFPGYDAWIRQNTAKNFFSYAFYPAYCEQLIDYNVLLFEKYIDD